MPPQRSQISCPRCRQPILAQVEQLFDVTADPGAKQRLLGGVSNFAHCPHCDYSGALATPIVYHDAEKELLLTFFPGVLAVPVNEQEKLIGPLINQVVNRLALEKRKAYLLRPQSFLTYQSLIERILGADGITPAMIQAQQQRVTLIERLLSASSAEARKQLIQQEASLLDAEFFSLFGRLLEGAAASGQEQVAQQMDALQKQLLTESEYGRQMQSRVNEIQEAVKTLQAAGKELTREKLLDILIEAPGEARLSALASLTRPGLDYLFFQSLSERIETKTSDERKKLEALREKLLTITRQIDQRVEEEFKRAGELLGALLAAQNIQKATLERLNEISEAFVQVLNRALQEATHQRPTGKKDNAQLEKLQQIAAVLQQTSAPPPEYDLLEKLLDAPNDTALDKMLEKHKDEITPEFASFIGGVLAQSEEQGDAKSNKEQTQIIEKLNLIYRAVLKFSMKKSLG
ncbi:MAG: CpXC domain-containing protein [Anaerolineales bacterium]|nr:CpXC domain-containing protein [Anaerolineales bacterium]